MNTHKYLLLPISIFLLWAFDAEAGTIINRPVYLGLNQGLVGYWSFDGQDMSGNTAYDRSPGNANNGTLTNGPARTIGKLGQGLSFDGSNDSVSIGDVAIVDGVKQMTASIWTKYNVKNGLTTEQHLFNRSNCTGMINSGVFEFVGGIATDGSPADGKVSLVIFPVGEAFTGSGASSSRIDNDAWHLITGVYDGSQVQIYIDGIKENGTTLLNKTLASPSSTPLQIGVCNGIRQWNGSVDEARIYNRALSPDEIRRLYNIGATTKINATPKHQLTNGLVGYWSFDGPDMAGNTAYDRSPGNANNGTLTNGPARTIGKLGQGLDFDGTNDFVTVQDENSLDITGTLTITAWINKDTVPGATVYDDIVMKAASGAEPSNYHITTLGDEFLFGYNTGPATFQELRTSTADLQSRRWYHVAAVYNDAANSINLYVNGVAQEETLVSNDPENNSLVTNTETLRIGFTTVGEEFDGQIDDVRIYNRALSPDEIRRLYNMGATTKINATPKHQLTNGLVGYWSFDGPDMAGNTAYDRSPGNANNGTLTNGPVRTIGRLGQGLDFDGADDFVEVDSATGFSSGSGATFTLAAWAKTDIANSDYHTFLFYGAGNTGDTPALFIDNLNTWCVTVWNTGDTCGTAAVVGRWTHVVGTGDGTNLRLYIDGVLVAGPITPTTYAPVTTQRRIGRSPGALNLFDGQIDDVRIYNRALSEKEIRRLYQMGR